MLISSDFFNLTYSGVGDKRIQDCISAINEICDNSGNDFFSRRLLQQKMGVTINTIKGYLKGVNEVSIAIFDHKEGNDIIYRRCQKGVKKVLIGVNWEQLKDYFDSVKGVKIPEKTLLLLKNLENICKNDENTMLVEKIDTLKLTPSLSGDIKKVDVTHHKCYFCGDTPCVWFDEKRGNYLCETCRQTLLVNEEIIK